MKYEVTYLCESGPPTGVISQCSHEVGVIESDKPIATLAELGSRLFEIERRKGRKEVTITVLTCIGFEYVN